MKSAHAKRLMKDFGERLRAVRVVAGYEGQSDFAKDIGVSVGSYGMYERGDRMPPIDVLILISKVGGKSLHFLLTGKEFTDSRK